MNEIFTAISTLGFPIVMCIVVCIFVKYLIEKYSEQIAKMTEEHRAESKEMTQAIENNTVALTKLIEKLGE